MQISRPMDPILDIRDVSFAYRRRDRPALEGLTLSVPHGATLGVIGPNGAGKTTLLKLILGLLEPTHGTVRIDGQPPRRATRAGLVGYLPQNASVAPGVPINARQLVTLGLAGRLGLLRSPSREELVFVDELLDRVGLAARMPPRPSATSPAANCSVP
jgi:ABC-type Mn2+/Zn2+ transport system ATPase subunit